MPSFIHLDRFPEPSQTLVGPGQTPKSKGNRLLKYVNHTSQALKIGHQRVNIDVDLTENRIEGFTELIVLPTTNILRTVKLDCREMRIKDVYVNNSRQSNYIHNDILYLNDDDLFEGRIETGQINLFDLYSDDVTIHQHHLIRSKLNYVFGELNYDPRDLERELHNGNTEELTIILPENLRLELTDYNQLHTPGSHTTTPMHLKSKNTSNDVYTPVTIKIEYELVNPRNGINFVNDKDTDKSSWHAYTTNSIFNISTSSWVPCIDNLWDRNTWSLEINIPRTTNDIGNSNLIGSETNKNREERDLDSSKEDEYKNQDNGRDNERFDEDEDDDLDNVDLMVCSGDINNIKETPHPIDLSKKVVSWSIFNPVCAHHVGWAVGCFQSFQLAESTEDVEEEVLKGDALDEETDLPEEESLTTVVYYLPGQEEMARTTTAFAHRAIHFFQKEFGSFPFGSFAFVFVKNSASQINKFAGLSIIDDRLLYTPGLIEPMFKNTEILLESISSQWSGINITPQTLSDIWCIIGISGFMMFQYLKMLMGSNHYKFRVKENINEILNVDCGKKPMAYQFFRFPVTEQSFGFLRLKAPVVLCILDRRMTKTDKAFGLFRVIPKIFLQAMSGDLPNGTLSTSHFQHVCEKVGRNKLDSFFKQWVFGSGYPIFHVSQKFNRKRTLLEVSIRQVQHMEAKKSHPQPSTFIDDSIAYLDDEPLFPIQPVFSGPMTIRVHEADGTPYEHIVDVKEGSVKVNIQYNLRLRRMRKHKDDSHESSAQYSKLGDILLDEKSVSEWNLSEWVKDDDDAYDNFEWIRVDADFEWIAQFRVKQEDYMYASQLQYDRDVEAQYDAIRYFGDQEKPNATYCTTLTRTIMDKRYYFGVRIAAARALVRFSKSSNDFVGVQYLVKAFKELFCFPNSSIPLGNEFSDFGSFFLQKAIPVILGDVTDEKGDIPSSIKELLFNLIKYNDNSSNDFEDSFYVCDLIKSLTNCTIHSNSPALTINSASVFNDLNELPSKKLLDLTVSEIERLQKLDEWIPSYHSVISVTCLESKIKLAVNGLFELSFESLLYFTTKRYPSQVRAVAFKGLLLLGGLKNAAVLRYFLKTVLMGAFDPSFRDDLVSALVYSISVSAVEGTPSSLDDPEFHTFDKLLEKNTKLTRNQTNMVVIEDAPDIEVNQTREKFAKATLSGTIESLRKELSVGKGLKNLFWELLHTSLLSINERRDIFNVCQVLYEDIEKLIVKLPVPSVPLNELGKRVVSKYLGDGKVVFKREGRLVVHVPKKITTNDSTMDGKGEAKSQITKAEHSKVKLKLDLSGAGGSKKEKKQEKKIEKKSENNIVKKRDGSASSNNVIFDQDNVNFITFVLPSSRLAEIEQASAPKENSHASSIVTTKGTFVTIRLNQFSKSSEPAKASRYVKILTKVGKVFFSSTPFDTEQVNVSGTKSEDSDSSRLPVESESREPQDEKVPKLSLKIKNSNPEPESNGELRSNLDLNASEEQSEGADEVNIDSKENITDDSALKENNSESNNENTKKSGLKFKLSLKH